MLKYEATNTKHTMPYSYILLNINYTYAEYKLQYKYNIQNKTIHAF